MQESRFINNLFNNVCKEKDHNFWVLATGTCFMCEKVHAKEYPEFVAKKSISKEVAEIPF